MKTISLTAAALLTWGALLVAQGARSPEALFKAAQHAEEVQGDLKAAIEQYQKVVVAGNREWAARALLRMAECHQKLGDAESRKIYERLVREFPDQGDAASQARARLALLTRTVPQAAKTARQVWTGHGVDNSGSTPSADGRYLSFTDWDTGDLAIRDLATNTARRLTNNGGWVKSGDYAGTSLLSPDGRQVLFAWFVEKEVKNELRLLSGVDAGTQAPRTIIRGDDYFVPIGWMPDGARAVVLRGMRDHTTQIGIVSIGDGSYRSIKSLEWRYPDKASVSPDGRYIAYDVPAAENGSPGDIVVLASDGSQETTIVKGDANDTEPVWTSDGSQVLFLSDRTGNTSLWRVTVKDGRAQDAPVLVQGDVGKVRLLGVARTGDLYYYVAGRSRQNVYATQIDDGGKVGKPALAADSFVNTNSAPAWSRDGRLLAYLSARDRRMLVVRDMSAGTERAIRLQNNVTAPFGALAKWFPDGRHVLVIARDAQGPGGSFYRLSLDDEKMESLWRVGPVLPSSFDLSPDGRSIVAAFQNSGEPGHVLSSGRLVRYDIEEKREVVLKASEWFITVAVSPDGQQLAYLKSVRENTDEYPAALEVMPLAGGPSREIYRDPTWVGGSRYNGLGWTADQKALLFVHEGDEDTSALWRVSLSGGVPQPTGLKLKGRIKAPSVSPGGRRLVFSVAEADDNEVWTLEHFLPTKGAGQ